MKKQDRHNGKTFQSFGSCELIIQAKRITCIMNSQRSAGVLSDNVNWVVSCVCFDICPPGIVACPCDHSTKKKKEKKSARLRLQ